MPTLSGGTRDIGHLLCECEDRLRYDFGKAILTPNEVHEGKSVLSKISL